MGISTGLQLRNPSVLRDFEIFVKVISQSALQIASCRLILKAALNVKTTCNIPAAKRFGRCLLFCPGRSNGFMLGDLVAILAMVSILAIIILPLLFRARLIGQREACVNDLHQIQNGWILYNQENNGNFPYNVSGPQCTNINWVANYENYAETPTSTNGQLMVDSPNSQLAPFEPNYKLYRCPADRSCAGNSTTGPYYNGLAGPPRVRSYSMSMGVGPNTNGTIYGASGQVVQGLWLTSLSDSPSESPLPNTPFNWTVFIKQSMVVGAMRPAGLIVLVDEHPDSINDGNWAFNMPTLETTDWIDKPTTLHGNAGNFSYADGHAEIHPWRAAGQIPPVMYQLQLGGMASSVPRNPDIPWVASHISAIYP
jgi:prepilin-type processing-associated H-X9-DG protein